MAVKVLVSLCDFSGNWAMPWLAEGYMVVLVDPKHGVHGGNRSPMARRMTCFPGTVSDFLNSDLISDIKARAEDVVVLAAPPCTDFSCAGSHVWARKDADGSTARSLQIVKDCLEVISFLNPRVYAIENPRGRLKRLLLGEPQFSFQPAEFAGWLIKEEQLDDQYTKKTLLWGRFEAPIRKELPAVLGSKLFDWKQTTGSKAHVQELRSTTPMGFAKAFCEANRLAERREIRSVSLPFSFMQ